MREPITWAAQSQIIAWELSRKRPKDRRRYLRALGRLGYNDEGAEALLDDRYADD